ncbi:MAG TPA: hypothetical protein VLM16_09415 [Ginsengibacter sp.]|nr:hypothetical protein [Ginsengibacter sp.]
MIGRKNEPKIAALARKITRETAQVIPMSVRRTINRYLKNIG